MWSSEKPRACLRGAGLPSLAFVGQAASAKAGRYLAAPILHVERHFDRLSGSTCLGIHSLQSPPCRGSERTTLVYLLSEAEKV